VQIRALTQLSRVEIGRAMMAKYYIDHHRDLAPHPFEFLMASLVSQLGIGEFVKSGSSSYRTQDLMLVSHTHITQGFAVVDFPLY